MYMTGGGIVVSAFGSLPPKIESGPRMPPSERACAAVAWTPSPSMIVSSIALTQTVCATFQLLESKVRSRPSV